MSRRFRTLAMMAACGLLFAGTAHPSGGATQEQPTTQDATGNPEEMARQLYNSGLRARDKAWKVEEDMKAATGDAERAKLEGKMMKQFKKAAQYFELAVQKNPDHHQAHGSLGYALRRMGEYEEALKHYDMAIKLDPGYTEAIEYRAQAYLGLNRIDEAKKAYMQLFTSDRQKADELMAAMNEWVEVRRYEPAGVASDTIDSFAKWVAERSELASQTAKVSQKREW